MALSAWAIAGSPGFAGNSAFFSLNIPGAIAIHLMAGALLFTQVRSQPQRVAQVTLGICLLIVAATGHTAAVFGLDIARTSVGEALAIGLMGATLILFHARRISAAAVKIVWLAVVGLGMFGVVGHFLDFGALYSSYTDVRINPIVSIALLACAIGLWMQSNQPAWRERFDSAAVV